MVKMPFGVKVRYSSYSGYVARAYGVSASSTANPEFAVKALAKKLVDTDDVQVELTGKDEKYDLYLVSEVA